MRSATVTCCIGLLLLAWPAAVRAADAVADVPVQRLALIAGSNEGGADRQRLRYADTDADAVSRVLSQLGGLRPSDRILVFDANRARLLQALEHLAVSAAAARAGHRRVEVFFYYSGHSDENGLLPSGERVTYSELRVALARLDADVSIAILDSCSAGAFTRRKGGVFRPPFLVDRSVQVRGHAFLASSSINEAAQESDRIGGSFFTHFLISGLRGAADVSGDGRVTLNEVYNFAFHETLAGTEQSRGGAQHAAYDIEMSGTGDVVMTDLHDISSALTLSAELTGRFYIHDAAGGLAAELSKGPGAPVELGLEAGRYHIVVEHDGGYAQADVTLLPGRTTVLSAAQLRPSRGEATRLRGTALRTVPINVSLVHPVSINGLYPERVRNYFSFSLFYGRSDEISGAVLSPIAHSVSGHATGWSLSGAVNHVGDGVTGLEIAGLANVVQGGATGALISGGVNILTGGLRGIMLSEANVATGDLHGLQAALFNGVPRHISGVQMALINVGGDVNGLQLGLINIAREIHGAQVGLVNVAGRASGATVGLLSVVRHDGAHELEVSTTDSMRFELSAKLGARYAHGILAVGLDPFGDKPRASFGGGFGMSLRLRRVDLGLELRTSEVQTDLHHWQGSGVHVLNELRLVVGWRVFPWLALFAGPSLHVSLSDVGDASYSVLSALEKQWATGSTVVRFGPGFTVGVRLF